MGPIQRQLRGRRTYALIFSCVIFVFFYLSTTSWRVPPESIRLARFMNHEPDLSLTSTSSFDWRNVPFAHPPDSIRPLPRGHPQRLPRIQHKFPRESLAEARTREARRDEVRKAFKRAWRSYRAFAWKKDVLLPISGGHREQFSGWAATLVDSLDTLWIMGLREEFDEAVEAVAEIDFGKSSQARVNTFETTIRYLGGLLAAYDLSGRPILLKKAIELGDFLYAAFNTPNHMPVDFVDFALAKTGKGLRPEHSVVSASPGTLSMELSHLSQITGDHKYYSAAASVMDVFETGQNATKLPGVWPIYVSMYSQNVIEGNSFTLGGNADSLYEYLPKMHALMGGLEPRYAKMTRDFLQTADKHFFFRPMLPRGDDVLISGNPSVDSKGQVNLDPETEHLTCFIGGLVALGGRLLRNDSWVETGARLARGCVYAYRAMPTSMAPERWNMVACPSRKGECKWNERVWDAEKVRRPAYKKHLPKGFTTAKDPRYLLRPEAIESVFVLWRITGQREWQEAAWDMFVAVQNGTRTEYANAAVLDVTLREGTSKKDDYMETFWTAETLKYFYLVFSPPDVISLDEYVLNTEAHPFRRPTEPMPQRLLIPLQHLSDLKARGERQTKAAREKARKALDARS